MEETRGGVTLRAALQALGLDWRATLSDARKAYRRLSLSHHPDRVLDPARKPEAQRRFLKIRDAYEFLRRRPHLLRAGSARAAAVSSPEATAGSPEARAERLIRRYRELHAVRPSPAAEFLSRCLDEWLPLPFVLALYAALALFLLLRTTA